MVTRKFRLRETCRLKNHHYFDKDICDQCKNDFTKHKTYLYGSATNQDFCQIPAELQDLTMIEQQMVSPYLPVMQMYRYTKPNGQKT